MHARGPWLSLVANDVRLAAVVRLLNADRPHEALVQAESVLDRSPDHVGALRLVGEVGVRVGDARLALSAYSQVAALAPWCWRAHTGVALARFHLADLEGAYRAAQIARTLHPGFADSWHVCGLILERCGSLYEAEASFREAARLDPARFGSCLALDSDAWEAALGHATELLPGALRSFYARVSHVWEDFPTLDELRAVDPPLSPCADALYQGCPPVEDDPWQAPPVAIRLFRGNLRRPTGTQEQLAARIARAMTREALAWLGLDASAVAPPSR